MIADEHTILPVFNKADLTRPDKAHGDILCISAKTGDGLDALIGKLTARASKMMEAGEPVMITRARQRMELEACRDALNAFLDGAPQELELRAEDLRIAARALGRVTGSVDVEDVLDRIFGDFCIGK